MIIDVVHSMGFAENCLYDNSLGHLSTHGSFVFFPENRRHLIYIVNSLEMNDSDHCYKCKVESMHTRFGKIWWIVIWRELNLSYTWNKLWPACFTFGHFV